MLHAWHFFVFVWANHHHMSDLIGWLRHEYPGMPSKWYGQYAKWLTSCYSGHDLLVAVEPY